MTNRRTFYERIGDALQKGQVTGDCTLAGVLDGPEAGSRMLLRGGCPVWQTHSSGVLQRSLSRLQECTATGFLELDGTRVFVERFGAVPQIVVCGGGHVAVSVVRLAKLLGLPVLAMEDRTEYAQDLRDAGADTVFCLPFAQALEQVPGNRIPECNLPPSPTQPSWYTEAPHT